MVFERFGHFATRYRVPIIVAWIAAAVLITVTAPTIEDVASSNTADFLPDNAPFERAAEVYSAAFPEDDSLGSTVIVIDARSSTQGILNHDAATFEEQIDTPVAQFIGELVAWLHSDAAPHNLGEVSWPLMSPTAAQLMIASEEGDDPTLANRVALVRVNMTTTPTEDASTEALHAIDAWIAEHKIDGIETYQTGATPIVYDTTSSIVTSVDRTIWVTVVLVIVMLLLVYRSPISPLIPLSAVTVAYLITRGIVAYLGAHYITITSYANVLLVVVMYGAGTDYCLFLISRFREEMADHPGIEAATSHTVHRVGETITSSAGTIFVGFMAMIFAEMGIFNTSGPALAIGIVCSLLAGLTLVPALLATLGDRAFWPGTAKHRDTGRLYEITSKWVSTYPLGVILLIVAIMAPLSVYGISQSVTYDMLSDLPDSRDAVAGFTLMADSLGAGNMMPLTVVVTGRDPDTVAGDIVSVSDRIAALDGIADVRGLDDPLGHNSNNGAIRDLLSVETQLTLALSMMDEMSSPLTGGDDAPDLQALQAVLAGVSSYLDLLAERFPQVADDPDLQTLRDLFANPLQLVTRQDALQGAVEGLAATFAQIEGAYLMPTALNDLLAALPADDANGNAALFASLLDTYTAHEGTAFKLDIVLANNPSSNAAMDTVGGIRTILRDYDDPGDAVVSGGAVINNDIRDTMNRDLPRAIAFVLAGIFIVLMLMLRSIIAPLYLIGTVLLSFTFTLGLTNLVFKTLSDVQGLTWYVPFFAFVFLVALGIDYSIFLFGRIKEEVGNHGVREGVHVAVATTGAIITSAGIILSGTFAAAMTGEVMGLIELGFAVAVGVLIDVFVVRTMLDPALATLFGRWTWWPGGVPKAQPKAVRAVEAGD